MGGEITHKSIGHDQSPLAGIRKKTLKIEVHAGMEERLVRDLTIEKDLQIKIKAPLSHNNKSYMQWCALSYEEIKKNKAKHTVT